MARISVTFTRRGVGKQEAEALSEDLVDCIMFLTCLLVIGMHAFGFREAQHLETWRRHAHMTIAHLNKHQHTAFLVLC